MDPTAPIKSNSPGNPRDVQEFSDTTAVLGSSFPFDSSNCPCYDPSLATEGSFGSDLGPDAAHVFTVKQPDQTVEKLPKPPTSTSKSSTSYVYHVKWINYCGNSRPVLLQNENGPCPIIAIANVLSLRGVLSLPEGTELLTDQRLVSILSDILLSQSPPSTDNGQLLNYETTVCDALNLFPSLQTGLDINVRFNGVGAFEFTPAVGVFDLFKISLYHGWLVDPDQAELATVVGDLTYNQLTEKAIELKASTDPVAVSQGILVEDFLGQTASQLTLHGLCELAATVRDGHLAVLFRNNHYNTIYKHQGRIYILVTDLGLLNEPSVVWEILNDVDGDTQFVDSSFRLYSPTSQTSNHASGRSSPRLDAKKAESNRNCASSFNNGLAIASNIPSIHALEQACSSRLQSPSLEGTDSDMDLAARLQLAEIQSSKQTAASMNNNELGTSLPSGEAPGGSKASTSCSTDAGLKTSANSQSTEVESTNQLYNSKKPNTGSSDSFSGTESQLKISHDKLSQVCSEHLLAQAQLELGTGSDLDVAVQLQWAELNRHQAENRSSPQREHQATAAPTRRIPDIRSVSHADNSTQPSRRTSSSYRDTCLLI